VWSVSAETKKLFQEITLIIDGQSTTLAIYSILLKE